MSSLTFLLALLAIISIVVDPKRLQARPDTTSFE